MNLRSIAEVPAHKGHCTAVCFAPDNALCTGGFDASIRVWETHDWTLRSELEAHANGINSYSLSPDGKTLVSASTDKTLKLWEYPGLAPLRTLSGHRHTVAASAVPPGGQWVASASYDSTVMLWPLNGEGEPRVLRGHPKNVVSVAFSPDSQTLASGGVGSDVFLWSVADGTLLARLAGHRDAVITVSFDIVPGFLCSVGYEGSVILRAPEDDWAAQQTIVLGSRAPLALTRVLGKPLLFGSREHHVALLSPETFEEIAVEQVSIKGVYGAACSPDGRLAACAGADGRFRVWEVAP